MVMRKLFVEDGETPEAAQRRENSEAPFGRCGDELEPKEMYGGCHEPLISNDMIVCSDYPDCCRP